MKCAVISLTLILCVGASGTTLVLDDFESYDGTDNRVYDIWIDGFANFTGSEVSLALDPCSPVHATQQAMRYIYDNTVDWGEGYYSEIYYLYDFYVDWAALEAKGLTLWFYGDPANDTGAAEQFYLGVRDATGAYAQVRYGDNGEDVNDIKVANWTKWDIDLQKFIDAGVSMADVDSVHIGFGDRSNSPLPGGTGVVLIDNIQLYGCICLPELAHAADLSGDCRIDLRDLSELAQVWLQEQLFDLYEDGVVNLKDYAVLANLWLQDAMFIPR